MEPRRQKIIARVLLGTFTLLCVTWLAQLNFPEKISTNVLELLPTAEQSPEAALVRNLAGDAQARVTLFALRDAEGSAPTGAIAREFAAALLESGEFEDAVALNDEAARNKMGAAIFERRYALLLPTWLGDMHRRFAATGEPPTEFPKWLAETSATELESFLSRPEALPIQDLVQADPLLLVPRLLERSRELANAGAAPEGVALVWALTRASPLAEAGQRPVFSAIERASAELRALRPGVEVHWTGINRFAAASRDRIEREFAWLNLLSLAAVLAVGCVVVRRVWQMLHLVPVIVISLLGAWTASTLVFDRIHILVFVIGSLLSGVAIDYGFYIYMQPSLRRDEPYAEKLRRLLKPLLASCLTTVIGFSLLMASDLPLLREVGFFVGIGLLCALAAAMLYFAQLNRPFLETRRFGKLRDRVKNLLPPSTLRGRLRTVSGILLLLVVATLVFGLQRLEWRDDIRDLEIASDELHQNDRSVRALFGETAERTAFITHAPDVATARQHLDDFIRHVGVSAPDASAVSVGTLFPTRDDWTRRAERLAHLENFTSEFREALARHGFEADSFAPFFNSWTAFIASGDRRAGEYASLYSELKPHLTGPLGLLYRSDPPLAWFLTLVDHPNPPVPPAALSTVPVNQLESLNGLFTRYRWSALRLSLIGLGLVVASVFAIYPGRQAVRIALIPAGSCFFVFGLFGVMGQTLNLFHLLGAFLGVCLSHNYAIFSATNVGVRTVSPVSIRLSALCTAASFGVLALSAIPVIHALGMTVALIVITALLTVEIEMKLRSSTHG